MKRFFRVLITIILACAVIACTAWYFLIYDTAFTRDILLGGARHFEAQGNHSFAAWLYRTAYSQSGDSDAVAIELAEQYKSSGNYTKAEFTLSNAIADGGGVELYTALCKTYVEQDKLLDAVKMLDSISNADIKSQLDALRPAAPVVSPEPNFYSQYISVTLEANAPLYVTSDGSYPSLETSAYTEPLALVAGENTIYAVAVAESGLVSPLSIFGYTIGGIIEEVSFEDAAFEAAIRSLLGYDEDDVILTNDLWDITSFTMPSEAAVYTDLKYLPYLETLVVYQGVGSELSQLAGMTTLTELAVIETQVSAEQLETIAALPHLETLTLRQCGLSSIAPLKDTVTLTYLDLGSNTIRNIAPLAALKNLKVLDLNHNALTDLTALASLGTLKTLDVSYNSLKSLTPIFANTALEVINAEQNMLRSVSGIGKLSMLTKLDLSDNALTAVGAIGSCVNLTELDLSSNLITDISPLSPLLSLQHFDFSHNQVTVLPNWSKSCQLITINGSHNLLTELDVLSGMENLNIVIMDYNAELMSVDCLADCPVMIQVDIFGTKVADVSALTVQGIIVNYNPVLNLDEDTDEPA